MKVQSGFRAGWMVLVAAGASGCEDWKQIQEAFKGFTDPTVAQAMMIGVSAPESDLIDLSTTDFKPGVAATAFLANASDADKLDEAPIEGAAVTLLDAAAASDTDSTEVAFTDMTGGAYTIQPGVLEYAAGATWTVRADIEDESGTVKVELPAAATVTIPEQHTTAQDLTLDFTGQEFHAALIVVLDATTQQVTWSNQPQDVKAVYEFTRGSDFVTTLTIPGAEAFPTDAIYAVGVAGMRHGSSSDVEGFNTLLSSAMAGAMTFAPVSTVVLPDLPSGPQ